MMRLAATLIATAAFALASLPEDDVRAVLQKQVDAWNRGDIREFMETYDKSDTTLFVGKEVTRGHAQVLAGYIKRYPNRAAMGKTTFSGLEVNMLGPDSCWVFGKWHLERAAAAGGNIGGHFTLVLRKKSGAWKIVLDHTTAVGP